MPLPSFAVVDLETSGFSTRRHRILQIGLVVTEANGTVLDQWSTLVRLRWPLQGVGPTHIHGITRPMLRHAPRLADALDELGRRIDGSMFTAHNAGFDGAFLERASRDIAGFDLGPRLCTLRMSRRLDPDHQQSHRLADVCERYGVPLDNAHDAFADATATAGVLAHLIRAHGITDAEQLTPFLDRTRSSPGSERRGRRRAAPTHRAPRLGRSGRA